MTDGARARPENLDNSVKEECLNIMQRYASPILEAQHAWFQEALINLAEDERNLRAKRSLLEGLLLKEIYQRVKQIPLHSSQRAAVDAQEARLSSIDPQKILQNCTTEIHLNIESLLLGNIDAYINLEKFKQDLVFSVSKLQKVKEYQPYTADINAMIQLIDLYQFNDFAAIHDLSDKKRDSFIKFLINSFLGAAGPRMLSFRTILKRDSIIQALQTITLSLEEADTSEDSLRAKCLEACTLLEKFDQYCATKRTCQNVSTLLEGSPRITSQQLLDLQKDIQEMHDYYKRFRRVIDKFDKANTIKVKNNIVANNYHVLRNGAFLLVDFLITQTEHSRGAESESQVLASLLSTEPRPFEEITKKLRGAYTPQSTGGLAKLLKDLSDKVQRYSLVGVEDTMLTDRAPLSFGLPALLLSDTSSSKSATSISSSESSSSLNPHAASWTPPLNPGAKIFTPSSRK